MTLTQHESLFWSDVLQRKTVAVIPTPSCLWNVRCLRFETFGRCDDDVSHVASKSFPPRLRVSSIREERKVSPPRA
ncbi:unnamed protein product [Bathycoccus prasinos]